MSWRTRGGIAAALAIFFGLWLWGNREPQTPYSHRFGTMGTVANFYFYGTRSAALAADSAARAEFDRVSAACNIHDPASELSRLNATAAKEPFTCSDLLWDILLEARRAFEWSNGSFDASIKPLMDLWGFYRRRQSIPSEAEISAARQLVGWTKIRFDDAKHQVSFSRPGMAIDLGGIAKGYALDLAAEAVRKCGIKFGVLDLGGNLKLLSPRPGEETFQIGIADPGDPTKTRQLPEFLQLSGHQGVSTSGSYERFIIWENRRYSHIINPKSGRASDLRHAATVAAPTAAMADWMSTSLYLDPALEATFREHVPNLRVVIVEP